jgi:hypothetical protein
MGPRAVLNTVVMRKIPSPRGESKPRTPIVQPVVSRYTDWAIIIIIIIIITIIIIIIIVVVVVIVVIVIVVVVVVVIIIIIIIIITTSSTIDVFLWIKSSLFKWLLFYPDNFCTIWYIWTLFSYYLQFILHYYCSGHTFIHCTLFTICQ